MKKILYLTKYELRQIKKSAILTAIVLAIFLGALFGLISVQTGMVESTYAHLDKVYPESGYVYTLGASFNEIADFTKGLVRDDNYYEGLPASDIIRPDGTVFKVKSDIAPGVFTLVSGITLYPNDVMKDTLSKHDGCIVEGRWVNNPFEMCVDVSLYEKLGVKLGEKVTREGHVFTLVGVYDIELIDESLFDRDCWHICTLDADTPAFQWSWNLTQPSKILKRVANLRPKVLTHTWGGFTKTTTTISYKYGRYLLLWTLYWQ